MSLSLSLFGVFPKDDKTRHSKKLVLPLKVIQDAVKYWEDEGVITRKNSGYIVNNLQEKQLTFGEKTVILYPSQAHN